MMRGEWDATSTYQIGDIAVVDGVLKMSKTGDNTNPFSDPEHWHILPSISPHKPMISFKFNSDMIEQFLTALPIFKKNGWLFTIALDVLHYGKGSPDRLTLKQIRAIIAAGHKVLNHSNQHTKIQKRNQLDGQRFVDDTTALDEIRFAHQFFQEQGIPVEGYQTSFSVMHPAYLKFVKEVYSYAINAYVPGGVEHMHKAILTADTIDRYRLPAYSLESGSLQDNKAMIDKLIQSGNGSYTILSHHNPGDIAEICDYIKSKGDAIEVVTVSEGVSRLTGISVIPSIPYGDITSDNLARDPNLKNIGNVFGWDITGEQHVVVEENHDKRIKLSFDGQTATTAGDIISISQTQYVSSYEGIYCFSISPTSTGFLTENMFDTILFIEEMDGDNIISSSVIDISKTHDISMRFFEISHKITGTGDYAKLRYGIRYIAKIDIDPLVELYIASPKLEVGVGRTFLDKPLPMKKEHPNQIDSGATNTYFELFHFTKHASANRNLSVGVKCVLNNASGSNVGYDLSGTIYVSQNGSTIKADANMKEGDVFIVEDGNKVSIFMLIPPYSQGYCIVTEDLSSKYGFLYPDFRGGKRVESLANPTQISGWIPLPLKAGFSAPPAYMTPPKIRKYNGMIYIDGSITGSLVDGRVIAVLPPQFRRIGSANKRHNGMMYDNTAKEAVSFLVMQNSGEIKVYAGSGDKTILLTSSYSLN